MRERGGGTRKARKVEQGIGLCEPLQGVIRAHQQIFI